MLVNTNSMSQNQFKIINKRDSIKTKRVAVKVKNKYCFISTEDIKYVLSSSYYAEIYTIHEERFIYRTSIKDFIEKLDSDLFMRVNRSTIINMNQVNELISEGQGDFSISMLDGNYFSLSKNYKKDFFHFFGIKVSA